MHAPVPSSLALARVASLPEAGLSEAGEPLPATRYWHLLGILMRPPRSRSRVILTALRIEISPSWVPPW